MSVQLFNRWLRGAMFSGCIVVASCAQAEPPIAANPPVQVAAVPATLASPGSPQHDWRQWRGPDRAGVAHESGLADQWPADGPPLLWRTKGYGKGYSSLAIAKDRLYTMGKKGGDTHLIAADLSGNVLWSTKVGGGGDPNCTPTVDPDANLVFAVSHGGDLLCAKADTGEEVWRKNFGKDFGGKMMSGWGYSESPLVDGDRLICTPGSDDFMLAALNKKTGDVIWGTKVGDLGKAGKDGAGYASVIISNAAGVKQYGQLVGRGVIGVDARSGTLLWNYNRIANGTANIPTPIVHGNYVFCSSGYGDGGSALLELTSAKNGVNAREVYYKRANDLQNHHGGMVRIGDYIYFGHGHNNGFPVCVEMKSGEVQWERQRGPGSGSAAVLAADGKLYFRYEDGVMALIGTDPKEYQLLSQFKLASHNGKSWPHPVILDGRLYIRDQDEMLCYDVR